jgi:hypothetical protein
MNGFINQEKQDLVLAGFDKKVAVFSKSGKFQTNILGDGFKFSNFLSKN